MTPTEQKIYNRQPKVTNKESKHTTRVNHVREGQRKKGTPTKKQVLK
jgi:hypothetical protein